jgi:V/A-type H+-transporting ATPase subunit E
MSESQPEGEGVQNLIDRLREEGTDAGQREAQRLKDQAQEEAGRILADARQQAEDIVAQAKEEAESERAAGREALQQASRDTLLCVKESLDTEFRRHLRNLVGRELSDPEGLRKVLIAAASGAIPEEYRDSAMTFQLPERVVSLEDLRHRPEEGDEDSLGRLAKDLASGMLGEGVHLEQACDDYLGMKVRIEGADVTIDLTDEAIAEVLYRHLIPRVRAILDGIVQ